MRLESMNLKPKPLEKLENLALKGERYVLSFSGGELQLFAYRDQDAAAKDLQTVSADGQQLGSLHISWSQPPISFSGTTLSCCMWGKALGFWRCWSACAAPESGADDSDCEKCG